MRSARALVLLCATGLFCGADLEPDDRCPTNHSEQPENLNPQSAGSLDLDLPHSPSRLLVGLTSDDPEIGTTGREIQLRGLFEGLGLERVEFLPITGLAILTLPAPAGDAKLIGLAAAIRERVKEATFIEPDYSIFVPKAKAGEASVKDGLRWGFDRIDAKGAWEFSDLDKPVTVAVIDSGIAREHPAFKGRFWNNPCEHPPANRVDEGCNGNRGNGRPDDFNGWDFASETSEIEDDGEHGTNVSGVIAAREIDSTSAVGVAPNARMMVLKVYRNGVGCLSDLAEALEYAIAEGAQVINLSSSSETKQVAVINAFQAAAKSEIPIIAAAGGPWPCEFGLPNVICVGATDPDENPVRDEGWSKDFIHLGAPGSRILTTVPPRGYAGRGHSSIAAPHVTGAAVLLRAKYPNAAASWVRERIVDCGERQQSLTEITISGKRLNVRRALDPSMQPCVAP